MIGRREFMILLGCAAEVWPRAARMSFVAA